MFRVCPLPFDPQAQLAYNISMAEGRVGRRATPLSTEWKDKEKVEHILKQARASKKIWRKFDRKWTRK
eukprot:11584300-Alexandrium_andersonii.AAC.1